MDHRSIEEQSVAELYVLGRLAPADEASFEEHLLTCGECRERVRWADELRGALGAMAAEDRERARSIGLLAWVAGRPRWARLGLTAGLLAALALSAALSIDELRLRHRLAALAAAAPLAGELRRRDAQLGQATGELRRRGEELRRSRDDLRESQGEIRRREEALGEERRRGDELRARLAELSRPQVNAGLFSLGLVRGEGGANRVLLGPRPAWIVLSIELPAPAAAAPAGGAYRATLIDGRGRTVWSGSGLRPSAADTLVLGLYSSLLAPGRYRLVLKGPGEGGEPSEVPFEVGLAE